MTATVPTAPIPTAEVPQADSLEKVIETVCAISQGHLSHQEIAHQLGVQDRQGRYYRLAAEILKLVSKTTSKNVAALTPIGRALLTIWD
jgi:molybdenum cofactor biosynthesis enzyme